MGKSNIYFNNKEYQIDDSSLSAATTELKSHFSTVMSGSGAVINFGGTSYNIDSAKLSSARNAFVSYLGTIAGNGSKVVVDGVEYFVDSNKIQSAISELEQGFEKITSAPAVETKSFTFTDVGTNEVTTLLYEDGMTWTEWVESEYNTLNFSESDGYLYCDMGIVMTAGGSDVLISDAIMENEGYFC